MSTTRATKSGFSREMQQKLNAKYDSELAAQCLVWVRDVINSSLGPGTTEVPVEFSTDGSASNFSRVLHDGAVLATYIGQRTSSTPPCPSPNLLPRHLHAVQVTFVGEEQQYRLWSGARWYANPPKLTFKQMELIELFVKKAKECGVPDHEAFQTVDLYEDQNLHQVVICLQSLGRKAKSKGLMGFGPKEAEANPRAFTEEQLKAGENIIGLQMGTNKGASQAGMTFGKNRMILD